VYGKHFGHLSACGVGGEDVLQGLAVRAEDVHPHHQPRGLVLALWGPPCQPGPILTGEGDLIQG
jgi:hypothetical protein